MMATAVSRMASYAKGGKVKGPGTGTSDSVPVRLSKGEFVVPADTVRKVGADKLHAMVKATHQHVTPKGNMRVRKMANGGVVGDDDPTKPTMSYGDQMSHVGGAIADAAGTVAKTVFGAPGYGLNALTGAGTVAPPAAAPAPAAPTPAPSAIATLAQPYSPARDSQAANPAGSSTPIPTVNGASGITVPDAPGVSKFVQNGRTAYTNVAGDNGAALAPAGAVSTQNNDAAQTLSDRYGAAALLAATPQPALTGSNPGLVVGTSGPGNSTAPETQTVRSILNRGNSRQDLIREQLANSAATNAATNATTRDVAQTGAASRLASSNIAAAASNYNANTSAGTAQARLATETPEIQAKTQLTQQQVAQQQRLQDLQKKYLAATDPAERRQLYEALIASQGHVRSLAEKFTVVPQGSQVDPATGVVTHNPSKLFDNQLGKEIELSEPTSGAGSKAAPQYETGKVYQDAKGNKAKWDGQKFVPA
jgi:hypothetical protein